MDQFHSRTAIQALLAAATLALAFMTAGCSPSFKELRTMGQQTMLDRQWGTARTIFREAYEKTPEHAENLHDLGVCSMMLARNKFEQSDRAGALREVDRAIEYFSRSINAHPGYQAAILGKNRSLELKGQFEDALKTAHWAAKYVGPSAKQYIFLANEYEERGDWDAALLRCRQAVAMEPNNPDAHKALGMLLYRTGNRKEAIDVLFQSLRLDPLQKDVSILLRNLGEPVPQVELGVTEQQN